MKIKNYRCKSCGSQDFFLADNAMHIGIYCNECGKWVKWANKDERNLYIKQHLNSAYGKLAQEVNN